MAKNYSHKDLRNAAFVKKDLSGASFSNSDLRGAKFTGSNLLGADFSHVITGLTPANIIWIFLTALITSGLSGYIAMLSGRTIQVMLNSADNKIRMAGFLTCAIIVFFIVFAILKGVGSAVKHLIIPTCLLARRP